MARKVRYSVYDMMDEKGVFDSNPANTSSGPLYSRQEYPKMLYHPEGKEEVTVAGEKIRRPWGDVEVLGEQRELISKIVRDPEEEAQALHDGWHDHPAKAIAARPGIRPEQIPQIGGAQQVKSLEEQIRKLNAELAAMRQLQHKAPVSKLP